MRSGENVNSARKIIKNNCAYMNMRVCTVGNIGYPQLRKHTIGDTRLFISRPLR